MPHVSGAGVTFLNVVCFYIQLQRRLSHRDWQLRAPVTSKISQFKMYSTCIRETYPKFSNIHEELNFKLNSDC